MSPLSRALLAIAFLLAPSAQVIEDNRVVVVEVPIDDSVGDVGEEQRVEDATLLVDDFIETPEVKVNVSLYYESLCPDSVKFVANELQPTWEQMATYMNIRFIPFGKSGSVVTPNGNRSFYCQHGPRECVGNKMQSCALSLLPTQDSQVKFVTCVMRRRDPSAAGPQCAELVGLDFEAVRQCFYSSQGEELQLAAESETNSIRAPLKFVPTIVYNGQFDQRKQDESLHDFKGVLCSLLPQPPPACSA